MKKNLSKKISLLLCSTFFLSSIMGSSFVYANPTMSTDSGDAQKTVATRKRSRSDDSQENSSEKRARMSTSERAASEEERGMSTSERAAGEEKTGMSTPQKTANKERRCPDAPKKSGLKPSVEVQARRQSLNKRFLSLFIEMCQRHRISRRVYGGISGVEKLFYTICFKEELFSCSCFTEFKGCIKWFLESLEEKGDAIELIFINARLSNFAERYSLDS